MNGIRKYDIVINGGGLAGLGQALALSDTGLSIALVDRAAQPPSLETCRQRVATPAFSPRVSALTPASREFLAQLGVWQALETLRYCPYREMEVWETDGTGRVHFSAAVLHVDHLGYIVENDLLVAALADKAAGLAKLDLLHGRALQCIERHGEDWQLTLDDDTRLHASLLIGADGSNSPVREHCGFATRAWHYGQQALVCSVRTSRPHNFTAWQCFLPTGPLAFLPLSLPRREDQHYCSIVWSCDEALAAELLALPEAEFSRRLAAGLEQRLGAVELLDRPQAFALQQRHARDYVQDGVALVGDAAHTIHPLAGQGINLGFADVQVLAEVIQHALQRGEPWYGQQVLSRYQRQRKPENLAMMLGMEGFKRAFGSDALWLRYLRNQGLKIADGLPPLKHALMRRAMGL